MSKNAVVYKNSGVFRWGDKTITKSEGYIDQNAQNIVVKIVNQAEKRRQTLTSRCKGLYCR